MSRIDFDNYFKMQITAMKWLGVHPETKYTIYKIIQIIISLSFYTMYFIFVINCIINYDLKNKDFFNTIRNVLPAAYYITMVFNYYLMIANREIIGNMMNHMKKDYDNICNVDYKSRIIIYDYAKKGLLLMKLFIGVLSFGVAVFVMKTMVISLIYKYKGEYSFVYFYEFSYPHLVEDYKHSVLLVFIATYIGEMGFSAFTALVFICTFPFGPISMLHACGQLEIVKNKFEKLFEKDDIDARLNEIIKDLQNIYG